MFCWQYLHIFYSRNVQHTCMYLKWCLRRASDANYHHTDCWFYRCTFNPDLSFCEWLPQQTVEWHRGTVNNNNRLTGNVTVVQDQLFNVTNTITLTTTSSDDGVKFICQSSYTGELQLIRQADVVFGKISMNYGYNLKYLCTFDLGIRSVALNIIKVYNGPLNRCPYTFLCIDNNRCLLWRINISRFIKQKKVYVNVNVPRAKCLLSRKKRSQYHSTETLNVSIPQSRNSFVNIHFEIIQSLTSRLHLFKDIPWNTVMCFIISIKYILYTKKTTHLCDVL